MGGHHHNGVANNSINNVVRIAMTMMIHALLRWTDASEKSLWHMDMDHAARLHNHTTQISSGMSTEEFFRRSKYFIVPYTMLIYGYALHMPWDQYYRMVTICLSGCQGQG